MQRENNGVAEIIHLPVKVISGMNDNWKAAAELQKTRIFNRLRSERQQDHCKFRNCISDRRPKSFVSSDRRPIPSKSNFVTGRPRSLVIATDRSNYSTLATDVDNAALVATDDDAWDFSVFRQKRESNDDLEWIDKYQKSDQHRYRLVDANVENERTKGRMFSDEIAYQQKRKPTIIQLTTTNNYYRSKPIVQPPRTYHYEGTNKLTVYLQTPRSYMSPVKTTGSFAPEPTPTPPPQPPPPPSSSSSSTSKFQALARHQLRTALRQNSSYPPNSTKLTRSPSLPPPSVLSSFTTTPNQSSVIPRPSAFRAVPPSSSYRRAGSVDSTSPLKISTSLASNFPDRVEARPLVRSKTDTRFSEYLQDRAELLRTDLNKSSYYVTNFTRSPSMPPSLPCSLPPSIRSSITTDRFISYNGFPNISPNKKPVSASNADLTTPFSRGSVDFSILKSTGGGYNHRPFSTRLDSDLRRRTSYESLIPPSSPPPPSERIFGSRGTHTFIRRLSKSTS